MGVEHPTPGCCAARFDYTTLLVEQADAARSAAERIKARTAAAILDTGRDLIGIKRLLGHGRFGCSVRAELGMTPRSSQNYLRVATLMDSKSETVSHLPAGVVYEIARSPAAVQDHALKRLGGGEIGADQVRPALRAAARALRQGGTGGQGDVGPPQRQAADSTDPEPTVSGSTLIVGARGRRVEPLPLEPGIALLGRQTLAQDTATASNNHE